MKEIFYAAEKDFLERYLKERAACSLEDMKEINASWVSVGTSPIPKPGTDAAVNEIYSVDGDTARIKIEGVLTPEGPDAWDKFWGEKGTSYKTIQAAMERAKTDSLIERVQFDIDSPGGTLAGCDETWQAHKDLERVKPTRVIAGNLLASAAYEIASPASAIFAASPSSRIGSIGVLVATYDWTKWEENIGIKEVIITSSNAPDKHPDVATKHGRDTIKKQLDALERIFYAHIAESRGVTTEHIAEHFGRGGVMVAQDPSKEHEDAIRAGMIDGLFSGSAETDTSEDDGTQANFENATIAHAKLIARLKSDEPLTISEFNALLTKYYSSLSSEEKNNPAPAGKTQEGQTMLLSELLKANPAAAAEIEKAKAEAKAAGAEEAKAELSARVDKVLPIIQSAAYPANIKTIACNVLAGKAELSEITTVVAVFDGMQEKANSEAAQEHTQALGSVNAEAPSNKSAADKEIDAALQAELDKRKVK